jgi:competence protein ComEC
LRVIRCFAITPAKPSWDARFSCSGGCVCGPVGEYFLLTLAAQLMTLPVIVYHFHRFSLVALIANPIILPVQPALMVLGGMSLLCGLVDLSIGKLLAYAVWPLAGFTIRVVEGLANTPYAEFALGSVKPALVIAFYGIILLWVYAQSRIKAGFKFVTPAFGLAVLIALTVQVWRVALAAPDGLLHVVVLDVNPGEISGEAVLIQSPQGRFVLINGGPSQNQLSNALGRRLVGSAGALDVLVVAGVEEGQIRALPGVIPRYLPENVIWAGETHANRPARYLYEALKKGNRIPLRAQEGMSLDLGEGARLNFLAVRPRGAVLLLTWQRFRMLLPIGLDFEALETLETQGSLNTVTAVLLAGNGYAPLNSPKWVQSLQPEIVLISVAARDLRGLPDDEVLLTVQDYPLLRTDENGWIELVTDGTKMWVEVERKQR